MAKVEKIIQKMKTQPNGIKLSEAEKVLNFYGYLHLRTKGSHKHFGNDNGDIITIKIENPLKIAYVKDILYRIGE